MSHQSGIQASGDLLSFFATVKDGRTRLIKVVIDGEQLILSHQEPVNGTWESDYNDVVLPHLSETESCYMLYRLDSQNQLGHEWLFILWVPNFAHIRQKMLYASTRTTLRKQFGDGHFKDDITAHARDDVTLEGYKKHLASQSAPPPLTMAEEELAEIKRTEIHQTALDDGQQTMRGIDFRLSADALQQVELFRQGAVNYLQLSINVAGEHIDLADTAISLDISGFVQRIPEEQPRYHLFRFNHEFEGQRQQPALFIYSMPGYKCSIKERMLYSSCKAGLTARLETVHHIPLVKKLEVEATEEISEDFLMDCLHPAAVDNKPKFSKPKGPGGRGPKRLIKE